MMKFYILTLFPEIFDYMTKQSIIGRAQTGGYISVEALNIRDYTKDKHRHVDDYPYGGGAGMVMQAEPICEAYDALCERVGKRLRLIYMSPQGKVFNQKTAKELALSEEIVLLCGHYEGIDERAIEITQAESISVGDYVLTGGELPALTVIDCVSRMVPGVLSSSSTDFETFEKDLLEYPQYTRPEVYRGLHVPEVLLSGHHKNISEWRTRESIKRTLKYRPDLLK
ncbi:hypothetical protein HMPREF9333_00733 [Johnsonella ignava ATCC 51276]|uniref:tRNA (guanine-N(1)-)-methyltransferase n=1 Tax=Johnsonella ignava ATCC 51276 TaxID=679200 RepID=G5GGP3_9FIRM|nr:tRNA (guanosine(37)-N1)-methyltransferase TrmD [Johnsonella ignava]EHI56203.1 hypothetical protein HMPREF9333_00733 [Johnsonella ignava ATCC 51276]